MRGFSSFLIALFLSVSSFSYAQVAQPTQANPSPVERPGGDDPVGWPWGMEVPFPFDIIQGVWHAEMENQNFFFTITPILSGPGLEQLLIRQITIGDCKVISRGVANLDGRIAVARMQNRYDPGFYTIQIRAFTAQNILTPVQVKPIQGKYVVLTLTNSERSKTMSTAVQLMSSRIPVNCR